MDRKISVKELAAKFGFATKGKDRKIESLGKLHAPKDSLLSFAETEDYFKEGLQKPNVSVLVTNKDFGNVRTDKMLIFAPAPRLAFYQIHNHLVEETDFYVKKTESVISPTANIHKTAFVGMRNVIIGDRVTVGPNVTILEKSIIGNDSVIQPGTVIGSEGFECVRSKDFVLFVKHGGGVRIGERVEIGSCTCVDKGVFDDETVIGNDTKIDNLVHVAHGVVLGERTLVVANCGLGGSVKIGNDVWVGFASTILPGLSVGDRAFVSIGAVVTKDVPEDMQVTGNFAIAHSKFLEHLRKIR